MNKNDIQDKLKQMEQEMADLRKKLDEPEVELYRGWMPAEDEDYCYASDNGQVEEAYANDLMETGRDKDGCILGIFPTKAEAKASYDRHMAGEECKKIISKWIAKLEPGWKPDWEQGGNKFYVVLRYGLVSLTYDIGMQALQDEWYFPSKVANNDDFRAEIEPHFRKWLGVE